MPKWDIDFVDVMPQSGLAPEVFIKAREGWEPFAVTWVPRNNSLSNNLLLSKIQRFWFKKPVEEVK